MINRDETKSLFYKSQLSLETLHSSPK